MDMPEGRTFSRLLPALGRGRLFQPRPADHLTALGTLILGRAPTQLERERCLTRGQGRRRAPSLRVVFKRLMALPAFQAALDRLAAGEAPDPVDAAALGDAVALGARREAVRAAFTHLLKRPAPAVPLDRVAGLAALAETDPFIAAFAALYGEDRLATLRRTLDRLTRRPPRDLAAGLERLDGGVLAGWVVDRADPSRTVSLLVHAGPHLVASMDNTGPRPDLAEVWPGLKGGGFETRLALPDSLMGGGRVALRISEADTGQLILPRQDMTPGEPRAFHSLVKLVERVHSLPKDDPALADSLRQLAGALPALSRLGAFGLDSYALYRETQNPETQNRETQNRETQNRDAGRPAMADAAPVQPVAYAPDGPLPDDSALVHFAGPADRLWPQLPARLGAVAPGASVITLDRDHESPSGTPYGPCLYGAPDPDWLMAAPLYGRAVLVRGHVVRRWPDLARNAARGDAGALWALQLAVLATDGDAAFHHVPEVLWTEPDDPAPVGTDADFCRRVTALMALAGGTGPVARPHEDGFALSVPGALHWRWPVPEPASMLSIIIPTRDRLDLLAPLVDSVIARLARPDMAEILIVDNDSADPDCRAWLTRFHDGGAPGGPRQRVVAAPGAFNWSRGNNLGAAEARGDLLLFLNNDTLALCDGFDDRLRGQLARPEIGAVGARLLFADGRLQHAGMVLRTLDRPSHEGMGERPEDGGYLNRTRLAHQVSALTGAFLACTRTRFNVVDGFDEGLAIAFSDVDFCFKLRRAGWACLYDPALTFRHDEGRSRGFDRLLADRKARYEAEAARLAARWPDHDGDPYHPPAFSDWGRPFSLLTLTR
ncbi:glycosyltransferase [Yunchengibacter salinarum]|uniref:glycosyltransferase n=1 Tax=Yunchengibacter salinarum TaxID=3133399 RepID=UPI0035B5CF4F